MSSRKRKYSTYPETDGKLSKRARLLSTLWKSQEKQLKSPAQSQGNPSSTVYKIKAIIGEKPAEYLIDRAGDPITGENYTPDWQPKANVNTAAIKAWEKNRTSVSKPSNSRPRRQRRRRRRPASVRDRSTTDLGVQKTDSQARYISETSSHKSNLGSPKVLNRTATSIESHSPSSDTCNIPEVTVQVSQHSSLDRHRYTVYHSALSSREISSSRPQHPDSGLGESSPEPDTSIPVATQGNTIVPDSQSLPGSSSYIPASDRSTSIHATNTSGLSPSILSAPRRSHTSQVFTSSNAESSAIIAVTTAYDSLRGSSRIEVAASQPSVTQSSEIVTAATQRSVIDSSFRSTSTALGDHHNKGRNNPTDNTRNDNHSFKESPPRRNSVLELFEVSEDHPVDSHPSQATTTDDSILSTRDPNSQTVQPNQSEQRKEVRSTEFSSNFIKPIPPTTLNSQEPPQPPPLSDDEMSDLPSNDGNLAGGLQSLGTKEKLRRMREASAAKKEAARKGLQSNPSSAQASPSGNMERQLSQSSVRQGSPFAFAGEPQPALSPVTRDPPPVFAQGGSDQPLSPVGRITQALSHGCSQQPLSPVGRTTPALSHRSSQQALSPVVRATPALNHGSNQQPLSPVGHVTPALSHGSSQQQSSPVVAREIPKQPLSPATQAPTVWTGSQPPFAAAGIASPSPSRDQLGAQVQWPGLMQSRAGTDPPEIPNKLAYEVQEEPDRLEVQPILMSTELPLPMRSSQSIPHTPTTPSRLAMHAEASPSQTAALEPKNLGKMEFIIPLCMRKRILQQYVDTMSFYTKSIRENMTKENLSEKSINHLNVLLGRLANVSTHIGLEGGGPGSQDTVKSEQEAIYAELSSEKFKFLGCLFEVAKDDNLHIALIAKSGPLHDIVETFLLGKHVSYNRPATFSRSDPRTARGHLQVSVLASGQGAGNPIEVARKADLVIALDETFNAKDSQVVDLRKNNTGGLAPVIRLIIYASVEHFDLCLPRTLEPIDRLRKLISCVWHTQSIVGELKDHEPNSQACANIVATLIRGNTQSTTWKLPNIQPIQNLPVMDSDSSLSDAMSDVSNELGRPPEFARKYWPYTPPATADNPYVGVVQPVSENLPNGKRAFDLEHGDSLVVQAKKQKMAQRANAGLPLEEPHTVEILEKWLAEGKAREQRLMKDVELWKTTADSHAKWAEARQFEYEGLRDKWSNLHHDKLDLKEEVATLTKKLEKARLDRIALQGERGVLKKDMEEIRQQLINNPVPNVAEAARKDAQIRDLQDENITMKKKLDLANGQLEYARGMYQDSSSRAVELASELESLQKIFEPTKSKLDHEIRRRKHERETDPKTQQLQLAFQEIQTLRAESEGKDRMIKRKEDQITVLERGRGAGVQTRGSSAQPRSPRGASSRGASPAAGMLGGGGGGGGSKGPSGLSGQIQH